MERPEPPNNLSVPNVASSSAATANDESEVKVTPRLESFLKSDISIPIPDNAPEYQLIDMNLLKSSVECFRCPECYSSVQLEVGNQYGFAAHLSYVCSGCGEIINSFCTSSSVPRKAHIYDVNRRKVKSFLAMGKGFNSLQKYSMFMNMKCMSESNYYSHAGNIYGLNKATAVECLIEARRIVREYVLSSDPSLGPTSVLHIPVSYDGSWHKRGFTSNYGIGCIIHVDTGLVIDYCVLSKVCHSCSLAKIRHGGDQTDAFKAWYEEHKPVCAKNYSGSSPNMETHAAEILWRNSMNYNLRYTSVLSDGDAKVYSHLTVIKIYGDDVKLEKEECINHVSKSLGTGLRKAMKEAKMMKPKVTLGGIGVGNLKESTIVKLTQYYHNAILDERNNDVKSMKKSCLATLDHCSSTDEKPNHSNCPTGTESWCFYQRALAKKEKIPSHKEKLGHPLKAEVVKHIRPLYERLTDDDLLRKCLKKQTQNANESLHSCIWRISEKVSRSSMRKVDSAAAQAITEYNFGKSAALKSMVKAGLSPGRKSVSYAKAIDKRRKKRINARRKLKFQKNRRAQKLQEIREEEKKKKKEGKTYGAGEFEVFCE